MILVSNQSNKKDTTDLNSAVLFCVNICDYFFMRSTIYFFLIHNHKSFLRLVKPVSAVGYVYGVYK